MNYEICIYQSENMEFTKENIKLICADNMKIMAQYPDNYFDLAVLDPPYGLGKHNAIGNGDKRNGVIKNKTWKGGNWDELRPTKKYFDEILRISKNQIIFGGNYFTDLLPQSNKWLIWDKMQRVNQSDCELAWTSFSGSLRIFQYHSSKLQGFMNPLRFHPTEKPVKLYDFCFDFAKAQKDWKIIDTNFGSASSAISAYYFGFAEYVGIEIDKDYFNDAIKRFKNETMQQRFF